MERLVGSVGSGNPRRASVMPGRSIVFAIAIANVVATAGFAFAAEAADSGVLARLGCDTCHLTLAPDDAQRTVERYADRRGPDLFYAGAKYRADWLAAWLADPLPIRPAGITPSDRTRRSPDGDVLESMPTPHPRLESQRIDEVVRALAALEWGRDLLPQAAPVLPSMPRMLAELNFTKFKGCGSCHRVSSDGPPLSGPDLFGAWMRLRPEFLASYIAKPQAWDPVAPMPDYGLTTAEVGKLMEYLRLLSEEEDR